MDKDYTDKMCSLVNDKQTYESRKRDPTPALQLRLNSKVLDLKKTKTIDIHLYYRVRCRVPQSAKLYGLPRLHKPNIPMRSIVKFCGSPTYQLSEHLTSILKPTLTDKSRQKIQSTDNFIDAIKTVQIPDEKSLNPSTRNHFSPVYHFNLPLIVLRPPSTNHTTNRHYDLMDLLHLCLTSAYFQYDGKHYKQLHGTAMGSPVSVVVAKIVMQNIEEQALATYGETLLLWLRYVDD